MQLQISIAYKKAIAKENYKIVCGNSGYTILFSFDQEWNAYEKKTARFNFSQNGIKKYIDVLFEGNECEMPVLSNTALVEIGVYAGDLCTTTPCVLSCEKSILCGSGTHEDPPEDVYIQLLNSMKEPYIGENGNWFVWDMESRAFVDSGFTASIEGNEFTDEYKSMLDNVDKKGFEINSPNLITSGAVADSVLKLVQNLANSIPNVDKDTENKEVYQMALDGSVYGLRDAKAREMITNISMQKIAEITTVDGATKTTIITDAEENLFKLDEIYVFINTSSAMPEAKTWFCYVNGNNSADTEYYLFSFSTKTTGNIFLLKSERVCEKLWFTQSTNNLISGAFASQYYTGSRLPAVDYITSITLHHSGIPAGSKIIVCGRKVVE